MAQVFFPDTKDALKNITDLFDFVHPMRIGFLYAREEVSRLMRSDKITNDDLQKIIDPLHQVPGVNYIRAFSQVTVEEQDEKISWVLLNNLFSIYEGWTSNMYIDYFERANLGFRQSTFTKNLQFPKLQRKLAEYFLPPDKISTITTNAFYEAYVSKNKQDINKLDNLLMCYRVFKEMRNCYMHNGSVVNENLQDAYIEFLEVATTTALDVPEVPRVIAPQNGEKVKLSLRGVIGFAEIVRKMLIIVDNELIKSKAAELHWKNNVPDEHRKLTLNSKMEKVRNQMGKFANECGFITPHYSDELKQWLVNNGYFTL